MITLALIGAAVLLVLLALALMLMLAPRKAKPLHIPGPRKLGASLTRDQRDTLAIFKRINTP